MADARTILVEPASSSQEPKPDPQTVDPAGEAPKAEPELPEKYRGKTVYEIAEMHQNAEREIGRQGNELGTWRDLVAEMSTIKRRDDLAKTQPEDPTPSIDNDDFLTKPVESVQTLINNAIDQDRKERQTENAEAAATAAEREFERDFPDWRGVVATPEFTAWAQKSQSRLSDAARAAQNNDAGAARNLMNDWYAEHPITTTEPAQTTTAPTGVDGARKVATESSGNAGVVSSKDTFTKSGILDVMMNDPDKYHSADYQARMKKAISEGRYRRE